MLSISFYIFLHLNEFKYRDRVTIVKDILKSVTEKKEGKKLTQIMQSANLNYVQTKKYLHYMLVNGFLAFTEKETYKITKEGSKFLYILEKQKLMTLR